MAQVIDGRKALGLDHCDTLGKHNLVAGELFEMVRPWNR